MRSLIIIAHDIRSTHNIGSLLRTADGFGVDIVYISGFSPYPLMDNDSRLPHISLKLTNQINKTALGAIDTVNWKHSNDLPTLITQLKSHGYRIIGLEQASNSQKINNYQPPEKCALLLGSEVDGIDEIFQQLCDDLIEIPMYGKKESFNVTQAAAIAMYVLRES